MLLCCLARYKERTLFAYDVAVVGARRAFYTVDALLFRCREERRHIMATSVVRRRTMAINVIVVSAARVAAARC